VDEDWVRLRGIEDHDCIISSAVYIRECLLSVGALDGVTEMPKGDMTCYEPHAMAWHQDAGLLRQRYIRGEHGRNSGDAFVVPFKVT
jgi:hypothetical protein